MGKISNSSCRISYSVLRSMFSSSPEKNSSEKDIPGANPSSSKRKSRIKLRGKSQAKFKRNPVINWKKYPGKKSRRMLPKISWRNYRKSCGSPKRNPLRSSYKNFVKNTNEIFGEASSWNPRNQSCRNSGRNARNKKQSLGKLERNSGWNREKSSKRDPEINSKRNFTTSLETYREIARKFLWVKHRSKFREKLWKQYEKSSEWNSASSSKKLQEKIVGTQ